MISRILEKVVYLFGLISAFAVMGITALILLEVFTRYVLSSPLGLADEFSGYALVFISAIGFAYTWKMKTNVRITFLMDRIRSERIKSYVRTSSLIVAFAFISTACVQSVFLVMDSIHREDKSNTMLAISVQWPQLPLILGYCVMALWILFEIVQTIKAAKKGERLKEEQENILEGVEIN